MTEAQRRQIDLAAYLVRMANLIEAAAREIREIAVRVKAASENADMPFNEGLQTIENLQQSFNFSQAARLSSRYAVAEYESIKT